MQTDLERKKQPKVENMLRAACTFSVMNPESFIIGMVTEGSCSPAALWRLFTEQSDEPGMWSQVRLQLPIHLDLQLQQQDYSGSAVQTLDRILGMQACSAQVEIGETQCQLAACLGKYGWISRSMPSLSACDVTSVEALPHV